MQAHTILFASDFGAATECVGICHAVIASIAPQTRVIDLAHDLVPFDVDGAGIVLQASLSYAPESIAVFVVDPGVSTTRRGIAALTGRGDTLLSAGVPFDDIGEAVHPESLMPAWQPDVHVERERLRCEAIDVNRFGNVRLGATPPRFSTP